MKKKIYTALIVVFTIAIIYFVLLQVNKFSTQKIEEDAQQNDQSENSLSVEAYEQLLESLAPNPNTSSITSEEEYEVLSASIMPSTSTTIIINNEIYEELIKSLEP